MFGHQHNAEDRNENSGKKALKDLKSDRRNSAADIPQTNPNLENEEGKTESKEKLQMFICVNLLKRKSLKTKTASPPVNDRSTITNLLHPEHAKLTVQKRPSLLTPSLEPYDLSLDENTCTTCNGGIISSSPSSVTSSITSISNVFALTSHTFDPTVNSESRRSSTMTNKYSPLEALDLEYALIKTGARGSIGPHGLSQSLQKLTFTQSLAFPALARGISNKKSSSQNNTEGPVDPLDSGVNAFAKVATVVVLILLSVLVFGVLYKFIRT